MTQYLMLKRNVVFLLLDKYTNFILLTIFL